MTVTGNLVVQANGYSSVENSTIGGNTRLNGSYGVQSANSEHDGNVIVTGPGFFYSIGPTHPGNVTSTAGETFIESGRLARNLNTTGDVFTDLFDTMVERGVNIIGAESGSFICASEVDGALTLAGIGEIIQLEGPKCDYRVFGADVALEGNTAASIVVEGNVIRGDLTCTDNATAPTVVDNRIRGCDGAMPEAATTLSRSAQVDIETARPESSRRSNNGRQSLRRPRNELERRSEADPPASRLAV